MDLSLDDEFKRLAEAAHTAASFLKALGEAGVLGPEAFLAMQQRALELFGGASSRATELGKSPEEAIRAGNAVAAPLLQELVNQAILQNATLTPEVQALVDKAGIVPEVEFQQLRELQDIRKAVQNMAGITPGGPGGPNGPGTGPGAGGGGNPSKPPKPDKPGYAQGGRIERDPSGRGWDVRVGEQQAEWIVPESELGAFAKSVLSGRTSTTGGGGFGGAAPISVSQPVNVTIAKLGKGAEDDVEAVGAEIARAVAAGRHPLIRALQKQGFERK